MAESKTNSSQKQFNELTEEQKAAAEKAKADAAAKAEAEKKLQARIKAAQTRTEILETDAKGKPTKTKDVQSKLLPDVKERGHYHVEIDKPNYDKKTGKKLSKARNQIFSTGEWSAFKQHAEQLGWVVTILWDPTKYNNQ
jgi:seryl-tRNA synthetase